MEESISPDWRKKAIAQYFLIVLVPISALLSFWALDRSINLPDVSVWMTPMVSFSAFYIFVNLLMVVADDKTPVRLVILLAFLFSFLFSFDLTRVLFGLMAVLFTYLAAGRIRKDLTLNIRVDLGKSLSAGKTLIVVSLALLIASQYFSEVRDRPSQTMIPSVGLGNASGMITSKVLSLINPEYRDINDKNLTVDDFLEQIGKSQLSRGSDINIEENIDAIVRQKGGDLLPDEEKESIRQKAAEEIGASKIEIMEDAKNLAFAEGRKRLSEIAGKELTGKENMADVFSEAINQKITSYFQPVMTDREAPPLIPAILALILFLTVFPLGNFLTILLIPVVQIIFHLLRKSGAIKTRKVMMEVERLE